VSGVSAYKGCPVPDTDADGLNDDIDKCPLVAGTSKYMGCPVPDSDNDGINDENDKCPQIKGVARYKGCPVPDADKDGVNDEEDKCPNVPGDIDNEGCPKIEEAVIKKVDFTAKSIQFEAGSSDLLVSSKKSLDELASVLMGDKSLKLKIDGHTDNTGNSERNKQLSETRANTVKNYLIKKGVDAARLTAEGFGSDKPLGDNNTAEGRAVNRRTELTVSNH